MKKIWNYFTTFEKLLWLLSVIFITAAFFIFDGKDYLTLTASLIGATALILCAKGNPIGEALIVVFALIYGYISYACAYYGELITYVGMSLPMAIYALVCWLRNPFGEGHGEVRVNRISRREAVLLAVLSVAVTALFYFILRALGTASLIMSTLSVTTSFAAVYLTARRSKYYALAYALNDAVLIVLWLLATAKDPSYVSVIICFIAFIINDVYGFINWLRMEKRQAAIENSDNG